MEGSLLVSSAVSMAGVLADLWKSISAPSSEKKTTLLFPQCATLQERSMLPALIDHLETCKEVCESFGSSVVVLAVDPAAPKGHPSHGPVPGLILRRFEGNSLFSSDDDGWDDDWDLDQDMLDAIRASEAEATMEGLSASQLSKLHAVPDEDSEVATVSKEWVQAAVADLGVCPFTTSSEKAGLPTGEVHYPISRASTPEDVYAAYWHEVALLESAPPKALSTTLLVTPHFGLTNVEAFMGFSDTLNNPLESLRLEESIQLVFFHPQWVFRDGQERQGGNSAGNFARRSPFPMINILRTPQVRIAQRAIPTGQVYAQNENTLGEIGSAKLQRMLVERDWSGLSTEHKVDRRSNELYDTAQRLVEQYAAGGSVGGSVGSGAAVDTQSAPVEDSGNSDSNSMDIDAMLAAMEELEQGRGAAAVN